VAQLHSRHHRPTRRGQQIDRSGGELAAEESERPLQESSDRIPAPTRRPFGLRSASALPVPGWCRAVRETDSAQVCDSRVFTASRRELPVAGCGGYSASGPAEGRTLRSHRRHCTRLGVAQRGHWTAM